MRKTLLSYVKRVVIKVGSGVISDNDGLELIDETPRHGLFGLEVAFVHPDAVHGVLTEVVSPA